MEIATDYGHAIVSVVIVALMAQVLNALTGIRKGSMGMVPGQGHDADYADGSYRLDRAYMNSVETIGFFGLLVLAAILSGANPLLTNIAASLVMILRIAQNVLMLRGIGRPYGGIRTQMAILSSIAVFALGLLTIIAVLIG